MDSEGRQKDWLKTDLNLKFLSIKLKVSVFLWLSNHSNKNGQTFHLQFQVFQVHPNDLQLPVVIGVSCGHDEKLEAFIAKPI